MKSVLAALAVVAATLVANVTAATAQGKPVGGPSQLNVTVWTGGASFAGCANLNTVIPTNGSAGTAVSVQTVEDGCAIIEPFITKDSYIQAEMLVAPKTNTLGCWIQLFEEGGCGFTLSNPFFGMPFPGIIAGDTMGCAQIPQDIGSNFGGVSVFCA